jgi:delta 1-pyrroline-5-carboxylate dehydrogenase
MQMIIDGKRVDALATGNAVIVKPASAPPPYINKNNCPLYRTGNPRKRTANHNRLW